MAKSSAKRFTLYADFGQIHLCDPSHAGSLEDAWTAQATEDRVAVAGDMVAIRAKDVADVGVSVEWLPSAPADDAASWDHVTESSIDVASGKLAILGCSDGVNDARRFPAARGSWRLRASHANLAKGREQIRLQLWPAPRRAAKVIKRWSPPPKPPPKPLGRIASAKRAVQAVLRGETDAALAFLFPRAQKGDYAAASTALQLLAFRGQWRVVVPLAMTVIAEKVEGNQAERNNCASACDALRRASMELEDPSILKTAESKLATLMKKATFPRPLAHLRGEPEDLEKSRDHADFFAHKSSPKLEAEYRGQPKARARHLMSLAHLHYDGLEDEQLALWDPKNECLDFDHATWVAQILARRKKAKRAWEVLESRLSKWWPSTIWDVAPVGLLLDSDLAPILTKERCAQLLATARGEGAP